VLTSAADVGAGACGRCAGTPHFVSLEAALRFFNGFDAQGWLKL
jgi:hypothetical protein